jgi:hypothetical protein
MKNRTAMSFPSAQSFSTKSELAKIKSFVVPQQRDQHAAHRGVQQELAHGSARRAGGVR